MGFLWCGACAVPCSNMSSYWRQAGLNYLKYSAVCARVVRRCLKPDFQAAAIKQEESAVKAFKWEDGKQIPTPKKINP